MATISDTDLAEMFDLESYGGAGTTYTVSGTDYQGVQRGPPDSFVSGDIEVWHLTRTLRVRTLDALAASIVRGTVVTIAAVNYVVETVITEQAGWRDLVLRAQ